MSHVTRHPSTDAPGTGRALVGHERDAANAADGRRVRRRTLLLVVGSGRSGTSVLAGVLAQLRFRIPQPEVAADETNPRGFGEPQWVVDFHTAQLSQARVQVTDARPGAWAQAGRRCYDARARDTLRTWLRREFAYGDHVLVKDPRLLWFIPLWRQCAEDLGADVRFVTMLRHPAEVVRSKERWYDAASNPAHRLAGWVNTMLYTERATRGQRRAYVRFGELLDDWALSVATVGETLGLDVLQHCSTQEMRDASAVIDPGLYRSTGDLDGIAAPHELRAFAQRTWEVLLELADADGADATAARHRLDQLRDEYVAYYDRVEAVAYSSILAAHRYGMRQGAQRARLGPATGLRRVVGLVPPRWRDAIPIRWRRAILRVVT